MITALPNRSGQWCLSRIIEVTSSLSGFNSAFFTAADIQKLATKMQSYHSPYNPLTNDYYLPFALTRIEGNIQTPTNDTIILPDINSTLGDLRPSDRNQLRTQVESLFTDYSFTDQINRQRIKQAFSTSGYTNATTIEQILIDLFNHLDHGEFYDLGLTELHNTEYTDDFSTDPSSRWSHRGDSFGWDSGNSEYDCAHTGSDIISIYTANNAGSLDHEAQVTTIAASAEDVVVGAAVRMYDNASYDMYCFYGDRQADNHYIARINAGGGITGLSTTAFTFTDNNFYSFCLAAEGTGATVDLSAWIDDEGGSKPSDPGWHTDVGNEDDTYADTSADRLVNGTNHTNCGIGSDNAISADVDTMHCYFKLRAVADRAGGSTPKLLTLTGCGM